MKDAAVSSSSPTPYVLELTVKSWTELLDASVPTCLGQALHEDVVEYLLEAVAGAHRHAAIKLNLVLPAVEVPHAEAIAGVIRAHFDACRADEQRHLRHILRDGRFALVISLAFLVFVNALGQSIRATFTGRFAEGVASGLEIFGWVAMWKPAEFLLYDWIPVRRRRNLLARLAGMEISCRPANP